MINNYRQSISIYDKGKENSNSYTNKNYSVNNDNWTNSNLNINTSNHYTSYKKRLIRVKRTFKQTIINKNTPQSEIKFKLKSYERTVYVIDILSAFFNIIILIWTYLNHFTYNSQGYTLTTADNIQRLICLGLSLVIIVFLIIRLFLTKHIQIYQYLLHLRASMPRNTYKIKWLLLEILVHLFQLYPYVSVTFIIGTKVTYSLDMIFFFFSIFRVYVIFKVFFSWNSYFNGRARRIFQLFNIRMLYPSIYRIGIKHHSYFTLFTIFIFLLLASSYIFKVFENWHPHESDSIFGSLLTCLWFILVTMLNIGYGDYVPVTVLGRLVSVFVCFAGLFLKSILTATLFTFAIMVDDGEQKAYNQINLLYSKNQTKSLSNFYYTYYIKNKMKRLTRHKQKYKLENIIKWQNMNQLRDRYYLRVLSNSKIPLTIKDFCSSINKKWDSFGKDSIYNIKEINRVVEDFTEFCIESLKESNMKIIKCMVNTYQMINLCYMILYVGGLFHVESYELIKNSRIVSRKDYEVKYREFKIKYYEKGISPPGRNRNVAFRAHHDGGADDKESKEGSNREDRDEDNDSNEYESSGNKSESNETYDLISDSYSDSLFAPSNCEKNNNINHSNIIKLENQPNK